MARPKKSGLSYFPLDTDFFDNDSRIKILKARYRADGIMIYVYLLCEIYKNGYYIQVDDDLEYIIASELGVSVDKVKQVLNFLLKKSLFDSKLFSSDKVLTSAGIQKRFQLGNTSGIRTFTNRSMQSLSRMRRTGSCSRLQMRSFSRVWKIWKM